MQETEFLSPEPNAKIAKFSVIWTLQKPHDINDLQKCLLMDPLDAEDTKKQAKRLKIFKVIGFWLYRNQIINGFCLLQKSQRVFNEKKIKTSPPEKVCCDSFHNCFDVVSKVFQVSNYPWILESKSEILQTQYLTTFHYFIMKKDVYLFKVWL